MYDSSRRRMIQSLAAFPFFGKMVIGAKGQEVDALRSSDPALTLVRFFNTLEASHHSKNRTYVSMKEIREWRALSRWLRNVREAGPRRTEDAAAKVQELVSRIDLGSKEVLPGWALELNRSETADGYLLTMRSADKLMVSDESGVIYQGVGSQAR
jgi:hypothetical protein